MKKFLLGLLTFSASCAAYAATVGDVYVKVTSTDELEIGKEYVIGSGANTSTTTAMGAFNSNRFVAVTNGFTISGNEATIKSANVEVITIVAGSENGSYALKNADGKYANFSGTSNGNMTLVANLSKSSSFTITFTNGVPSIVNCDKTARGLRYNGSSPRFTNYSSTSQSAVVIYKKKNSGPVLQDAGLSFPEATYNANIGEAFTAPKLTKATDAAATYTSSKPEVATVNASTGEVEILSTGTTVIKAETPETDTYAKGEASYTLVVVDPDIVSIYESAMGEDFSFDQTETYPWSHDTTYGLKGTAYVSGKTNACTAVAYSPVIDLTQYKDITLDFLTAFNNYKVGGTMIDVADFSGYAYIVAREEGATEWTQVAEATAPTTFNWDFYANNPVSLEAYSGKKVQFGFQYVSTSSCAGTWEVKGIAVNGKISDTPIVREPKAVVVTPTPVDDVVTVTKGEKVTFFSENASKLKVELSGASTVTTYPGDTYEYTATADEMITVTPIDAQDVEQAELSVTVSVEIIAAAPCGAVVFNPAEGAVKAGTEVTVSAENAAHFIFYALNADGEEMFEPTRKDGSSFTYTVTEECTLAATPYNSDEVAGEEGMATYTIEVVEGFTDDITAENLKVTGTTYSGYTYTSTNGISYDAFCGGSYPSGVTQSGQAPYFTIRNSNSSGNYGGIAVTASSNVVAANVTITRVNTTNDRKAFVYGSETPYATAKGINTTNVPEGSVKTGEAALTPDESTSVELDAYYPYIIILSNGSTPMSIVSIDWVARFAAPAVDLDHQGKLSEGGKVTFTMTHPKNGARIFYMHQPQQAKAAVRRAPSHSDEGWQELTEGNTVDINAVGDFHVYASDATGKNRSEISSFAVKDETTTGISEVEAGVGGDAEWFDLQGRRVSAPSKGNIYILKEGSKVSKRAF